MPSQQGFIQHPPPPFLGVFLGPQHINGTPSGVYPRKMGFAFQKLWSIFEKLCSKNSGKPCKNLNTPSNFFLESHPCCRWTRKGQSSLTPPLLPSVARSLTILTTLSLNFYFLFHLPYLKILDKCLLRTRTFLILC